MASTSRISTRVWRALSGCGREPPGRDAEPASETQGQTTAAKEKAGPLGTRLKFLSARSRQSPSRGEQLAAPRLPNLGGCRNRLPTARANYGLATLDEQHKGSHASHADPARDGRFCLAVAKKRWCNIAVACDSRAPGQPSDCRCSIVPTLRLGDEKIAKHLDARE